MAGRGPTDRDDELLAWIATLHVAKVEQISKLPPFRWVDRKTPRVRVDALLDSTGKRIPMLQRVVGADAQVRGKELTVRLTNAGYDRARRMFVSPPPFIEDELDPVVVDGHLANVDLIVGLARGVGMEWAHNLPCAWSFDLGTGESGRRGSRPTRRPWDLVLYSTATRERILLLGVPWALDEGTYQTQQRKVFFVRLEQLQELYAKHDEAAFPAGWKTSILFALPGRETAASARAAFDGRRWNLPFEVTIGARNDETLLTAFGERANEASLFGDDCRSPFGSSLTGSRPGHIAAGRPKRGAGPHVVDGIRCVDIPVVTMQGFAEFVEATAREVEACRQAGKASPFSAEWLRDLESQASSLRFLRRNWAGAIAEEDKG